MLQLCVGEHCLLWEINPQRKDYFKPEEGYKLTEVPKVLKDFLYDRCQTTVMGLGIEPVAKKLESETDLMIPEPVELRSLAEEKLGTEGKLEKLNVRRLAKEVLGKEMNVERPAMMAWFRGDDRYVSYSDDLVMHSSIDVYLVAQMGVKLLNQKV